MEEVVGADKHGGKILPVAVVAVAATGLLYVAAIVTCKGGVSCPMLC